MSPQLEAVLMVSAGIGAGCGVAVTWAVAHMMLGSLYAATVNHAEILGVDPAFVIRTLGLNVASTPRRDQ